MQRRKLSFYSLRSSTIQPTRVGPLEGVGNGGTRSWKDTSLGKPRMETWTAGSWSNMSYFIVPLKQIKHTGPSINVCWFQINGEWAGLAFTANCGTYYQGRCIWLEFFFQCGLRWNLGYSKDWLVITVTAPMLYSLLLSYQLHARGQGQLHPERHLAGPLCQQRHIPIYWSMTLNCPPSQAPSCLAQECCYQACRPLTTPPPIDELGW